MTQSRYEAVIFDCDGVLVDTENLSHAAWQKKLAELGLHLSFAELQHYFTGFTTQANLDKAEELLGGPLPEKFAAQVRDLFWQQINDHLPVVPSVESALQRILQPKATATNAQRKELDFKLQKSGLGRFFKHSVCCEDVVSPKPAPDIYLEAARRLCIPAHACAVIEDSVAGVQSGVAAGMTAYGYCRASNPKDLLAAGAISCFCNMADLPDILAC